jgi:hypothetical protein
MKGSSQEGRNTTRILTRSDRDRIQGRTGWRSERRTKEVGKRQGEWAPKLTWTWTWERKPREGSLSSTPESTELSELSELRLRMTSVTRLGETWGRGEAELGTRLGEAWGRRGKRIRAQIQGRRTGPARTGAKPQARTWSEAVVRVGTGYRVRKAEGDPRQRRFDVGYADRKGYTRKPGREAKVEASNMGRTLSATGPDARVKVMNAVGDREKRRRVSEYTGSGIRRKSRVGKRKLKPTKAQTKS